MKYIQPFDQPGNPTAPYVNRNAFTGTQGSIPPADFFNTTQNEIINVIAGAGLMPAAGVLQLLPAILALIPSPGGGPSDASLVHWGIDSGAANALSIASPIPAVTSVGPGFSINVLPANDVTGPATLTIALLGGGTFVRNIVGPDGSPLIAGDIRANVLATFVEDGAAFRLTRSAGSLSLPALTLIRTTQLWTKTPGSRKMLTFLTGAGASGGGGQSGYNGQGGGPGVTAIGMIDTRATTSAMVTIGSGGTAVGDSTPGNDGGTSTFGSLLSAPGGKGGENGPGLGSAYGASYPGGTGLFLLPGAPGGPRTGGDQAGNGGNSFWGGGGRYGNDRGTIADAQPGTNGGGGGGGCNTSGHRTSGGGGDGLMLGLEF